MGTLLLSAICALTLSAGNITERPDTTIKYIIDKSEVKNFDGSQLDGKTIESYTIADYPSEDGKNVTRLHVIQTKTGEKVIYIVDNKGYTAEEFKQIRPKIQTRIKSIAIYKGIKNKEVLPVSVDNAKSLILDDDNSIIVIETK